MKPFSIIVAIDEDHGIGKNNTLPWRLSKDLKFFKTITTQTQDANKQNAVIMGRKTWDSLPDKYKPLPNRLNIVLSKKEFFTLPHNVLKCSSLDHALLLLNKNPEIEQIFVIGGAMVFHEAIKHPLCKKIYVTHIEKKFDCDVFFPKFEDQFELINTSDKHEENRISYYFCIFESRNKK